MKEDKQLICNKLLECLRVTRGLSDVVDLAYSAEKETVTATFDNGHKKTVNVALDSGTAMIQDIIRKII